LYWNAIGTGWAFPIDAAEVEVRLPEPVPAGQMEVEGYTGPQGGRGQDFDAEIAAPGVARWVLTEPLEPREGFTIVLSFPKGIVAEPTGAQRAQQLLNDNRGVLVALAGFALLLLYTVRRWQAVGRDPRAGVIIARYEPPDGRSPAELRYLNRRGYDTRCFTSDLLTSAVHGDVVIGREERLLFSDRWRLERRDRRESAESDSADATSEPRTGARLPTVTALVEHLFPGADRELEL